MTAYLYVMWAVEDELVKLGISRNLRKRLSTHSGNSSNPLKFDNWKLYQFDEDSDARKIENLAKIRLMDRGLAYRGKRELFKCSPTVATDTVDELCDEYRPSVLRHFPFDVDEALESLSDFPCLPEYALASLSSEQRMLYWKGVRDALRCLSYFEGIPISRADFLQMYSWVKGNEKTNSELWMVIVDYYRNHSSLSATKQQSDKVRKVAWSALERIKTDRRFAYVDWQKLDDDFDD